MLYKMTENKCNKTIETIELSSIITKKESFEKILKSNDNSDFSIIDNTTLETKTLSNKSSRLENELNNLSNKSSIL